MRVVEAGEAHGSLKWIRRAVNSPDLLNRRVVQAFDLAPTRDISWSSPLAQDAFAEYRDDDFVRLTNLKLPHRPLKDFWPVRGPQWDALATLGATGCLLVEAKANIPELVSPGTSAEGDRLTLIERSLSDVKAYLGVDPAIPWSGKLYQYTNRLAHLYLARVLNGADAYLVFVYFIGDVDVNGPKSVEEWKSAITVAKHVLGLANNHRLSRYVADVFIDVSELSDAA